MSLAPITLAESAGKLRQRVEPGMILWGGVGVVIVLSFLLYEDLPWLMRIEEGSGAPINVWLNAFMDWFVDTFKFIFRGISWVIEWPMIGMREFLHWLPWPAAIAAVCALAYVASGWGLTLFCLLALSYMLVSGFWDKGMMTVALVALSVPLSLGLGLTLGVVGYKYETGRRIVQPTLDFMQTIPTFAYLIPILLLFGFGPVVGLLASAVYAAPPMARNIMLGLSRVPPDVVDSARMSGTTNRQLLWWVQFPSAMPTVMIGVNQTIMAALAMVIIAAVIGSAEDIGFEVLKTLRRAQFGQSLLAGITIVFMAMMMDRISRKFAEKRSLPKLHQGNLWQRRQALWLTLIVMAILIAVSQFLPVMQNYPKSWTYFPYAPINQSLTFINSNYPHVTTAIKSWSLFFFMLPIKLGFDDAVKPFSYGFTLTTPIIVGYCLFFAGLAALATKKLNWRAGLAIVLVGAMLYFGLTDVPWPAFILPVTLLAWQVGGWKTGLFTLLALLFMLITGYWLRTMLAVYLCGSAVAICAFLGVAIGVWASGNNRVSAVVRPINDTLQTIPLFVFLIPVLMLFKAGEFAGFLAIIMYAIVPAIRYTEHGIRNVNPETVEAAKSVGCTKRQILINVQLPLALPEIMLGINQTVLFGLAMLVITALVGTKGLGQLVYMGIALPDFGMGLINALGMAFIAMITDRIIQAWSNKKKIELGLGEI